MNTLTPSEQEIVNKAAEESCPLYNASGDEESFADGFKAGVEFALQELVKGRMIKFAEWISLKGLYQEIDLKWYDKFGGKVRLIAETSEDLLPLYQKYQEHLKQQEDEGNKSNA